MCKGLLPGEIFAPEKTSICIYGKKSLDNRRTIALIRVTDAVKLNYSRNFGCFHGYCCGVWHFILESCCVRYSQQDLPENNTQTYPSRVSHNSQGSVYHLLHVPGPCSVPVGV